MSRAVPWSIKDASFDAPQTARDAAHRSGGTVGDWLDALIADHAQETLLTSTKTGAALGRHEVKFVAVASVSDETEFELAATGTDGPTRRFAVGERQIVHVFNTAAESRVPTGDRADPLRAPAPPPVDAPPVDDKPPRSASAFRAGAATSDHGRLKEQIIRDAVAAITRRQAALEAELTSRDAAPSAAAPALAGATIGDIDTDLSALETRVSAARAERLRESAAAMPPPIGLDAEASQAFETLGQDLRRAVKDIDLRLRPNASLDSLGETVVVPLEARSAARADLLATTARAPAIPASPAPQPVSLRASTERPQHDLDAIWSDVRTLIDRFGSSTSIESLDRRMQDLALKVETRLGTGSSSALIEDLSRRIDALQSTVEAPAADRLVLEKLLLGIEERIGKARNASADVQHIEQMMNSLASRIEDSRRHPDTKAMIALETQIARLGERLERSEANLSSLDAVEHSLRELFSQLEHTRFATIDAAENAARQMARDTLSAAMQNPAVTGAAAHHADLADRMALEVQDLKLQQEAAEHRTQSSLSGLHRVVEKLFNRLDEVEADDRHSSARSVPAPSAEAFAPAPPVMAVSDDSDTKDDDKRSQRESVDADLAAGLIEPGEGRSAARTQSVSIDPAEARLRSAGVPTQVAGAEGSAPFIAAARRAAQAAQASAALKQRPTVSRDGGAGSPSRTTLSAVALVARTRAYLASRRRPILLGLAGLVVLLGVLEVTRFALDTPAIPPATTADATITAAPAPANVVAAVVPDTSPEPADTAASASPTGDAAPPRVAQAPTAAAPATPVVPDAAAPDAAAQKSVDAAKVTNPFLAGVAPSSSGLGEGLKALALSGDPAAQYEVGLRYVEGRTVPRDPKTGAEWFEKAATRGSAPAQYRLGSAYEKGVGEPRDPAQAELWYGRAADAGNIRAMHNLAVMTAEGAVGKPDYAKAAALFNKAASFGVRDSQFNLAILYARGLGIEQNLGQSYTWFAVAASQGDDDAAKKRDEVAARLDPKALEAAKAAADNFRATAYVRAANDVMPPPGGWDAVTPPAHPDAASPKKSGSKASVM